MSSHSRGQIWQTGTKRCVITPPFPAVPPFRVVVFDGAGVLSDREFPSYKEAVDHAIEELRSALKMPVLA